MTPREIIQDAFFCWIENGADAHEVEVEGKTRPLSWLFGRLAVCNDIVSRAYCDALEIPHGSTYASAVHKLKGELPRLSK
jgi:hypothetical protein